jgi:hypothetical protein
VRNFVYFFLLIFIIYWLICGYNYLINYLFYFLLLFIYYEFNVRF